MADPFFPNTPMPPQAQPQVPTPPQTPIGPQKKISKISMKTFLVGCAALFMVVIGGLTIIFYNLIKNPNQLVNLGINPATTKSLLQTFAVIFFGLLTFLGIAILVNNLYRLVTVKNKPKMRYGFGAIAGFFLFIFAISIGAKLVTTVRDISIENILDSNKLIMPYIQLKDGPAYTRSDEALKLIAPATIFYTLNTNYFNSQILPALGQVNIPEMSLDCGNGQILILNLTTRQFDGSCIYFKKGEYSLNLDINYINIPTGEKLQKSISAGSIVMHSEISIVSNNGELGFNDAKTEMSVGKVPSKVMFDASQVFKDLALNDYKILRDFDGDGTWDKQNQSSATFVYKKSQLYYVSIRLPLLNNYIYTFPIRVEQSDVPVCEIIGTANKEAEYTFQTNFLDGEVNVTSYQFDIIDKNAKNRIIDSVKGDTAAFNYQFPGKGLYAIQANFMTDDGKQGQCESDDIQVGATDFQIFYDLNYKSPGSPQFQKVLASGEVSYDSGIILIREIPTVLQMKINQIIPATTTTTTKVSIDGKAILSTDGKTFETTIQDSQDHVISVLVEDTLRGTRTEELLTVQIKRDDIVGKLLVTPDTVGTDPFTVKFDASTTKVNDPTDEIVYFTWDFGDGVIKKNLSDAVISHTYRYDIAKESGEYRPILTIKTKKGRQISISPETNIIVKRANQQLVIHIDSHPAQIANADDRVNFSLEINGLPSEVNRDFGNGKTLTCKARECVQTTQVYTIPGTYTIRAEVVYEAQPTIDGSIVLKVK